MTSLAVASRSHLYSIPRHLPDADPWQGTLGCNVTKWWRSSGSKADGCTWGKSEESKQNTVNDHRITWLWTYPISFSGNMWKAMPTILYTWSSWHVGQWFSSHFLIKAGFVRLCTRCWLELDSATRDFRCVVCERPSETAGRYVTYRWSHSVPSQCPCYHECGCHQILLSPQLARSGQGARRQCDSWLFFQYLEISSHSFLVACSKSSAQAGGLSCLGSMRACLYRSCSRQQFAKMHLKADWWAEKTRSFWDVAPSFWEVHDFTLSNF